MNTNNHIIYANRYAADVAVRDSENDLGTGHSSLSILQNFASDKIKIGLDPQRLRFPGEVGLIAGAALALNPSKAFDAAKSLPFKPDYGQNPIPAARFNQLRQAHSVEIFGALTSMKAQAIAAAPTISAIALVAALAATPVRADAGAGGNAAGSGGAAGVSNNETSGGSGGAGGANPLGGGGAAGVTGGAGGRGGGGGAHGFVGGLFPGAGATGGVGGAGGAAPGTGGGGGGGAGGYGAVTTLGGVPTPMPGRRQSQRANCEPRRPTRSVPRPVRSLLTVVFLISTSDNPRATFRVPAAQSIWMPI